MAAPNLWFPYRTPKANPRFRLFCLPPSGGGALLFRSWPTLFSADIEVCAVQPPGREARIRETAFSDIPKLVEALLPAVLPLVDRPYAIFGHSVGGWVGFDLIRALRQAGQPQPLHFFPSAISAPDIPDPSRSHLMDDAKLIEFLRLGGGYPEEVLKSADLMAMLFPTIRNDARLSELYQWVPGPPLDCPISAFVGSRDIKFTREEILAWKSHTKGAFREFPIDGDHGFVKGAAPRLAACIQEVLVA
jgi:medium-chain acyl-[acyl-carrier-protein] hydrolase